MINYTEIESGYKKCKQHKDKTIEAICFKANYEIEISLLLEELLNGTYAISPARRFAIVYPKPREVYAYLFRDRVVEHVIANRILPILEKEFFIPDSYSCREGKGVLYGVKRIQEQVEAIGWEKCWFIHCDISSFFPHMNRHVLWDIIEPVIRKGWRYDDDVEWWLNLVKMFVFHDPTKDCINCGDLKALKELPIEKCLTSERGEPIGNLLNQIFAIVYLTPIDIWLSNTLEGYGRYVDDMILLGANNKKLLKVFSKLRRTLTNIFDLNLNEKKTIIQQAYKGIEFTGYIIKPWGIYPGKRLRENSLNISKTIEDKDYHIRRVNSYLGFLRYTKTFRLRREICENTWKNYKSIYAKGKFLSIHKT